ncbi:hypothetical protein [Streptomyces violaceusniger]|uniref:Uncharacterized protein n=1 Tax=Streptomyces violaceusniger TaxID=68280 RepID=A0A4D4KT72_STRVO|nr:hypothetical protein SVIO_002410 [Streptomyces violaceusniger]
MTTSPGQSDLIDDIQGWLESCGWHAESGEGWRWVDHTYENDDATLRIRYLPNVDVIRFDFESEEHLAQLSISFEDSPNPILDLITGRQSSLSDETWRVFIASLIELSPRILSLADENAEDELITDPDEGVAALRELDWE